MTQEQTRPQTQIRPLSAEEAKARHQRNLAIAGLLGGMAVIFFVMTVIQLGGNIAQRVH
jgi:hypothetical protein